MFIKNRNTKACTSLIAGILSLGIAGIAQGADTIKVGVLHSLSGTMAISETTLKDTMLMLVDEQNKKGGLLGKQLEAVVVDPASDWPLFAEKARELIEKEKVEQKVKVMLFIDNGGWSMSPYVRTVTKLFSKMKRRFAHDLKTYYYHNSIYGGAFKNAARTPPFLLRNIYVSLDFSRPGWDISDLVRWYRCSK